MAVFRALTKMLATLAVASFLIFLVLAVLPGDVSSFLASRSNTRPTEESLHLIREQFGLDQPVLLRYGDWLGNALMGDFGKSWLTGAPVAELISQRIGPTLLLGLSIFMLGSVITFVWGGFAGLKPGRWPDKSLTLMAVLGTTLPSFVLGLLAIRLFANELGWASVIGDGTWRTVLLPAAVGGTGLASYWARPFRGLVAEALASDWALAARARGLGETRLLFRHALPNALLGFLPFLGVGLAGTLTGTILIETVFSWPGLGAFVIDSIKRRDLPVVQAFAVLAVVFFVLTTALADLAARLMSPRPLGRTP
ncbi:ABC transporter permease [Aestuariivirga sp.]|uniref:ABC transporter permease n=1 Tax=Aestuariivirga sp. TaxID=2650926 RepID=UPI003BAC2F79